MHRPLRQVQFVNLLREFHHPGAAHSKSSCCSSSEKSCNKLLPVFYFSSFKKLKVEIVLKIKIQHLTQKQKSSSSGMYLIRSRHWWRSIRAIPKKSHYIF